MQVQSAYRANTIPPSAIGAARLWGLSHVELHDRFWASAGVQVVRRGRTSTIESRAHAFLLIEADELVVARLERLRLDDMPEFLTIELVETKQDDYQESVRVNDDLGFVSIERHYADPVNNERPLRPLRLTRRIEAAQRWLDAPTREAGQRSLRAQYGVHPDAHRHADGWRFDAANPIDRQTFVSRLHEYWTTIDHAGLPIRAASPNVWIHNSSTIHPDTRTLGHAWIGAGVTIEPDDVLVGPAILQDQIDHCDVPPFDWNTLTHLPRQTQKTTVPRRRWPGSQRIFDIAFSIVALTISAPIFVAIMIAIWFEDGRPFFFAHRRQSLGGRSFNCHKFRTMHHDAEDQRRLLEDRNQCDGPQFFIEDDPRVTRVGKILRRAHLDELPQFFDVLCGHMSVVGPRPSPDDENQFCPAWRETRLSVRPGLTGLWQIRRSRQPNTDFQEWIRYDMQYVQRRTWRLDLRIIAATIVRTLRFGKGSA